MANVNFDSFFNGFGERLDQQVKIHLKNVYATLSMSLLSAAAGAYIHLFTPLLKASFLIGLIAVVLLGALSLTPDNGKNQKLRLGYLLGFAFVSGINLGPVMEYAIHVDPSIIPTAFMGTAVIFICFTISALISDYRKYLYLGGTLLSALGFISMLSLINLFLGSKLVFEFNLYIGLLVMCGFILFDTQLIIAKRLNGDKDYIWHAVNLFIDLINVFRYLLVILAQKDQKKKNKD